MQRSKGGAADNNRRFVARMGFYKRNHFFIYIFIELLVTDNLMFGIHVLVQPAFIVDTINRKHFYFTTIDKRSEDLYKLKPFIFKVICCRCWYQQKSQPVITISGNGHILL